MITTVALVSNSATSNKNSMSLLSTSALSSLLMNIYVFIYVDGFKISILIWTDAVRESES